jgi:hypothetical protein
MLFREVPPKQLVDSILATAGLKGIDDTSIFLKSSIRLTELEPLLIELQPYYFPSKDPLTKSPLTQTFAMTIFRQVLKEYSRKIKSQERLRKVWYSIAISLDDTQSVISSVLDFS